jgi:YrbI family 3-deoxy-D-manno-octulosonate 8-phosphate phosphatase
MKVAGVIPAKGTSSRVPSKNSQRVLGVPLFLWAANNLARVLPKTDIYVDSDSPEIRQLAERAGFRTIERPADLATNATDGNQLMLWQASQVDADVLIQHLPPMIFLRESTLRQGLNRIAEGHDSVFGAAEEALYLWTEHGPTYDLRNVPNSFTLPKTIIETMGLYMTRKACLESSRVRISGKTSRLALDHFEQIDIDTPHDLEFARTVARGLGPETEYTRGVSSLVVASQRPIRLLVLDVDGTLTDGGMYYATDGSEMKRFHTRDGRAIMRAQAAGVRVALLSAGLNGDAVHLRAKALGISLVHVGSGPKAPVLAGWIRELGLDATEVAFIGDDTNDLDAMQLAGVRACPSDADPAVQRAAEVVLSTAGGHGCVREFIDTFVPERQS